MDVPVSMSIKFWESLPKDLQNILYQLNREAGTWMANSYNSRHDKSIDIFKKAGGEVITLSPAEKERFKAVLMPITNRFIDKNEAEGRPARKLIAKIRELNEKYRTYSREELMKLAITKPVQGLDD